MNRQDAPRYARPWYRTADCQGPFKHGMADRLGWSFCAHQCVLLVLEHDSSSTAGGKFRLMTGLWMIGWLLLTTKSTIMTGEPAECLAIVERQLVVN